MAIKHGKSLQELASEVMRQSSLKQDWTVGSNNISVMSTSSGSMMRVGQKGPYRINSYAHGTLATDTGIPKRYYDRMMAEQPSLLDENVNTWLLARSPEELRLVRVLEGAVRAVLSNSYRRLDNDELLKFILPELLKFPGLRYESMDLTDTRLYLKLYQPSLQEEIAPGDVAIMGAVIRNSEVRSSELVAQAWVVRKNAQGTVAMNVPELGIRKRHVRRNIYTGEEGEAVEYYSDEALQADDLSFFLKVRDTVRFLLKEDALARIANRMREAAGVALKRPAAAAAVLARKVGLSDAEEGDIVDYLAKGGDISLWGLASAVASLAGDTADYDRASELETLAGTLITLPVADYRDITDATEAAVTRAGVDRSLALSVA